MFLIANVDIFALPLGDSHQCVIRGSSFAGEYIDQTVFAKHEDDLPSICFDVCACRALDRLLGGVAMRSLQMQALLRNSVLDIVKICSGVTF